MPVLTFSGGEVVVPEKFLESIIEGMNFYPRDCLYCAYNHRL